VCGVQGFTSAQIQMVEDNSAAMQHREHEINQIVRSIQDLNDIFKDLANMIVDQVSLNISLYLSHIGSLTLLPP
jgi:hypothetical protein